MTVTLYKTSKYVPELVDVFEHDSQEHNDGGSSYNNEKVYNVAMINATDEYLILWGENDEKSLISTRIDRRHYSYFDIV